jgi:hypothetical protein
MWRLVLTTIVNLKAGSPRVVLFLSQVIGRRRLTRVGRSASADHHPIASTSGTKKVARKKEAP